MIISSLEKRAFHKVKQTNSLPRILRRPKVSKIDLTQKLIDEPLNAYRIGESHFGVAMHSPRRPYIITCGLSGCKAIIFYKANSKKGLVCHLSSTKNLRKLVKHLIDYFDEDFSKTDVYVVNGLRQIDGNPTMNQIVSEISYHSPKKIFVDDKDTHRIRGIALNLETGKVDEIDRKNGWSWSDEHDTSINVSVRDFE